MPDGAQRLRAGPADRRVAQHPVEVAQPREGQPVLHVAETGDVLVQGGHPDPEDGGKRGEVEPVVALGVREIARPGDHDVRGEAGARHQRPPVWRARNLTTAGETTSGRSAWGWWPAPSTSTPSAGPPSRSAVSCASATGSGKSGSFVPMTTSAGAVTTGRAPWAASWSAAAMAATAANRPDSARFAFSAAR